MTGCFLSLLVFAFAIFLIVTLIRWFEQVTDAVDRGAWGRVMVLVLMPFSAWLYPGAVSTGRPTAVPRHEPARGFGGLPRGGIVDPSEQVKATSIAEPTYPPPLPGGQDDAPPPGTPKEFIGLPKIPPKKGPKRAAVDPDKLARLKAKMREQGMLGDES